MKGKEPSFRERFSLKLKKALGKNIFLCDNCKWNWRGACRDSRRPNATWCSEYEKRGR